ncbi:unnamed protein product [Lymnaea stagnalis]|uniref:Targeting protein for Xklp2 n=1 Tax=Lymnaea stagnalis TaxID=6523 RepID=A0AAV2IMD7_LYMST
MTTESKWDFDAPQFVDFTQPDVVQTFYDDTWFDRHTEDDDFRNIGIEPAENGVTRPKQEKPQRILKGAGPVLSNGGVKAVPMDVSESSPRQRAQPTRMLVSETHAAQTSSVCPSPQKRKKLSDYDQSAADPSQHDDSPPDEPQSDAVTKSPRAHQDLLDSPAANTRLKSANTQSQISLPISDYVSASPNKRRQRSSSVTDKKVSGSAQKGIRRSPRKHVRSPMKASSGQRLNGLRRSQSLRDKGLRTAALNATKNMVAKPQNSSMNSSKSNLSEHSSSLVNLNKIKTSEELELEKIALLQKEADKARKIAQDSCKRALTAQGYIPVRSTQPSTLPLGFHFKTDERIKTVNPPVTEQRVKDFTKSLREALPASTLPTRPVIHGLTKTQPFKLHTQRSTPQLHQTEKYESVAEKVAAFHKKTPDRFRSQPIGSRGRSHSASKSNISGDEKRLRSQSPKPTIPKTPELSTRGRSRPNYALSQEEKEKLEFEEHQKQQFKAHPVNQKIFQVPKIGVPLAAPKSTTVAEEFNFHYKKSGSQKEADAEEEKYEFHARPLNPKILQGPVGVKPVAPQPITIPESPAFALKNRIRLPPELTIQEGPKMPVKANPPKFIGVPFKPKLAHQRTVPEPFTVEERSKEMMLRKERKIQQVYEEERKAREFHAQDLPSDSPDQLPPKQLRPPTQPEPFQLEVDERGQKYQEEFKSKQIEEEERLAREAAQFKARPNEVTHKEPFQVQKSARPLTEINGFAMNTDQRAVERELFDQHIKAREAEIEALKREREERIEREQMEAVARLRQEAVHKASGVKKYKPVNVKPSDKPLTTAQSPRFSERLRFKHETDL